MAGLGVAGLAGGRAGRCATAFGLAVGGLLGVAACGNHHVAAFHPAGSVSQAASHTAEPSTAPASAAASAAPGSGGFHFPAGFAITFRAGHAGSAKRRAMIVGYENYVRSFWAAILTHGRDHAYRRYLAGNALTFARKQINYYRSNGQTVTGTARYSGIRVTNVYFGHGAVVQACVDVSGLSRVKTTTGKRVGTVYSRPYLHYLEQVAEGELPGGGWYVLHTGNYPATTSQGAICQ